MFSFGNVDLRVQISLNLSPAEAFPHRWSQVGLWSCLLQNVKLLLLRQWKVTLVAVLLDEYQHPLVPFLELDFICAKLFLLSPPPLLADLLQWSSLCWRDSEGEFLYCFSIWRNTEGSRWISIDFDFNEQFPFQTPSNSFPPHTLQCKINQNRNRGSLKSLMESLTDSIN